jgi:hypothetical protein
MFFFSLFFNINILKEHTGLAIIIVNSSLTLIINNMDYFKYRINNKNLVFMTTSLFIKKELTKLNFNFIEYPFSVTNNKHTLKPKGQNIYFYSCDDTYNNLYNYGYFRIKNILKKYFPHINLICAKSCQSISHNIPDNFKIYNKNELLDIYYKCFLGIRLVTFDGLSDTVQSLGMLGIKTIWNGGTPSGLSYETDDDIIYHIQNEEKKIGTYDEELANLCYDYLYPKNYNYIFDTNTYDDFLFKNTELPTLFKNTEIKIPKSFYVNLNIFLLNNYYIYHNNFIKYDILNTKPKNITVSNINSKYSYIFEDIFKINIHEILDDKYMYIFGVRFNNQLLGIEYKYKDEYLIGKLLIESNLPLKIFDGKNWINYNLNNVEIDNFKIKISNLNKWRVGISDEWINNNLNKNNVEFLINDIKFNINEIVTVKEYF